MRKKCPRCGGDGPFSSNKSRADGLAYYCKQCVSDKTKSYESWYSRNRETGRADRKDYYEKNKNRMNARVRKNYEKNREDRLEQIAVWKSNNKTKVKASTHNRRARKNAAGGRATAEQIAARIELYGGMCAYCNLRPYEHVEHVVALREGGTNWPANLRPACSSCNWSKSRRTWLLVDFGDTVGGDAVSRPRRSRLSPTRVKRDGRLSKMNASDLMEEKERQKRYMLDAVGNFEMLTKLRKLAERYCRVGVLKSVQICPTCGCLLDLGSSGYYCANCRGDEDNVVRYCFSP